MKLSMWMIANRLSPLLDIRTIIRADARPVLKSARLAYATDCVHVFESSEGIVYDGEGDRILLKNISLKEAFEILQGVFDDFQDWESAVRASLEGRDFQKVFDMSEHLLQNPAVLMDGNSRVLAITHADDSSEMDPSWRYMLKFGYAATNSILSMRYNLKHHTLNPAGLETYRIKPNNQIQFGGASCVLTYRQMECGRLTLLEKNRPLNAGDYQLLQKLSALIEPALGAGMDLDGISYNIFVSLISERPLDQRELEKQLGMRGWKADDFYQIALVRLRAESFSGRALNLLLQTIRRSLTEFVVFQYVNAVVILANWQLSHDLRFMEFAAALAGNNPVQIGLSLNKSSIRFAPFLLKQAESAIRYGKSLHPDKSIHHFIHYGIQYILDASLREDKLHACHPAVVQLHKQKLEKKDELYDTLKCYLENGCSLTKTAAAMYTHRNTILYRIRKCEGTILEDLRENNVRTYIWISMYILESESEETGVPL